MAKTIQAIKGMNDILPADSGRWEAFESTVKEVLFSYGYRNIRMPIVEQTDLFVRSIGEVTDIVEKEMYTFTDRLNGDSLTMRPEGTASCLRAVLEHNLLYDGPQKVWYSGPMFRHERPQKGRYRQFHQFGAEALGLAGPDVDAEQLIMLADLWRRLGLTDLQLELNTLGDVDSRAAHRQSLINYLEKHQDLLDEEAKRRLHTNPLRILDTKNPAMQDMVNAAPKLMDYINEDGLKHFEQLQKYLNDAGIAYKLNSRLVRGLDYYNLTVFEWVTNQLGAQGTVCGGGRYDGLIGQLGGKPAPACGFGMGVERLLLLLEAQNVALDIRQLDVYLVHQGALATPFAWQVAQQLRSHGFAVQQHLGESSFKSQMKKADQSGARFAIIIGDNEAEASKVTLKSLRVEQPQQLVGVEELNQLLAN